MKEPTSKLSSDNRPCGILVFWWTEKKSQEKKSRKKSHGKKFTGNKVTGKKVTIIKDQEKIDISVDKCSRTCDFHVNIKQ